MIVGLIDDCWALGPWLKLALEITAAVAVVIYDYRIGNILGVRLGWLELPVTVAWLVALTNAFNMIDGLDGLAAGVGAMVTTTLFLLSLYLGNVGAALILALLGGALIGFLPYNFHPARIFLGDSGSLFIGFVLAVTSVATSNKLATLVAILVPILALGLPLAELVVTTLRRLLRVMIVQSPTEEGSTGFACSEVLGSSPRTGIIFITPDVLGYDPSKRRAHAVWRLPRALRWGAWCGCPQGARPSAADLRGRDRLCGRHMSA